MLQLMMVMANMIVCDKKNDEEVNNHYINYNFIFCTNEDRCDWVELHLVLQEVDLQIQVDSNCNFQARSPVAGIWRKTATGSKSEATAPSHYGKLKVLGN